MASFFIDANLPSNISSWKNVGFLFVKDFDSSWPDDKIWRYSKENNLTIVTKDADFSNRILLQSPPPKVIHIKVGNLRVKDFIAFIEVSWNQTVTLSKKYKLVNVYPDRIEGIN